MESVFVGFLDGARTKSFFVRPSKGASQIPQLRESGVLPAPRMLDPSGGFSCSADGEIGHVDGFVVDDEAWAIRYIEVATRNWLPGRRYWFHLRGLNG